MSIHDYKIEYIKHIKGYIRKQYLDFLIKNGNESYSFYKHSLKFSKKLFIYKTQENIQGIIGFSNTISLEKSIHIPSYSILYIQFIYCKDKELFEYMIKNISKYAFDNNIPCIFIKHTVLYDDILISLEYDSVDCGYICVNESKCLKCNNNDYSSSAYYKEVLNVNSNRTIYDNNYNPNKIYNSCDLFYDI